MLNPDMPVQELLLHLGEMTTGEERTARDVIRWANNVCRDEIERLRAALILIASHETESNKEITAIATHALRALWRSENGA